MKSVVITGSSRGLGLAMAERFLESGCQVTLSGRDEGALLRAKQRFSRFQENILTVQCDVQNRHDVLRLWAEATNRFGKVDIWINNAGINQPDIHLWEVPPEDLHSVISTNLIGTIYGSQVAMQGMLRQQNGSIFNMEGFGSNDMQRPGLNLYGTTKRAVTYFTSALAKEAMGTPIKVCLLSPGMMVTDFVTKTNHVLTDRERTRRVFNILGDKPETVARFLVSKMLDGVRNGERIAWLTKRKAAVRFMTASFRKRNLFSDDQL